METRFIFVGIQRTFYFTLAYNVAKWIHLIAKDSGSSPRIFFETQFCNYQFVQT